jgi:hypothetical protein
VERALTLITEFPLAFPVLYEPDIRSAKVARFPYRVVYVLIGSNIDVVAVAHAKRRPACCARNSRCSKAAIENTVLSSGNTAARISG